MDPVNWINWNCYSLDVDGSYGIYGATHGYPRRNLCGGEWLSSSFDGTRSAYCGLPGGFTVATVSTRGCSQKKIMERDSCIPLL